MERYISFSGGVESTTMCILYGKGAKAIFCDTGSEHKELYERIDFVEDYLKNLHGGDFEIVKVKASVKTKEERIVENLTDYIIDYKFMPNTGARFCTRIFKIEPIEQYLSDKGEVQMFIGLNYDEQGRTGNLEQLINCTYKYPLIDDRLTREDCIEILNLHGLNPSFPPYMQRGGCKFCFFKKEDEYKAMYYLDRDTFNDVKELEKEIQDRKKKFFSIMPSGKSMQQLENECKQSLFSDIDMKSLYKRIEKTTYCGGFCHR